MGVLDCGWAWLVTVTGWSVQAYIGVMSCSEGEGCSDGKQGDGECKIAQPQRRERGAATGLQIKAHRR